MTSRIAISLVFAACVDEPKLATDGQSIIIHNALAYNALAYNALAYNAMTANALAFNGLNLGNGLDLTDADAHMFVEYLVSCALPADDTVTIQGETFSGALGIAPEWADGPCGESCQRWVSACLLARVNARGERLQISMRGAHDSLYPGPRELVAFPVEDGTFFGNLFTAPQEAYATSPRDDLALPRSCGDATDCPIEILGHSADVCARSSPALGRTGCPYDEAVTVYLH